MEQAGSRFYGRLHAAFTNKLSHSHFFHFESNLEKNICITLYQANEGNHLKNIYEHREHPKLFTFTNSIYTIHTTINVFIFSLTQVLNLPPRCGGGRVRAREQPVRLPARSVGEELRPLHVRILRPIQDSRGGCHRLHA